MKNLIAKFLKDQNGVTAIEYGLIAGLIAVVIAASATNVGAELNTIFGNIVTKLTTAATAT
jgi:pilus assembly protein Flp/PilA